MARLPISGSDNNTWGTILNDFLQQSHNADGSLKTAAVSAATTYVGLVTVLPSTPANHQECYFTDSTTAPTYEWHLKYNSTTTKWHFVGGSPLFAEVTTREANPGASYAALTTAGPSITLPLAGDYEVMIGAEIDANAAAASSTHRMSYDIGGTGAVDADALIHVNHDNLSGTHYPESVSRARRKTGLTAVTLTAKYKSSSLGAYANRWMRVIPVRVG